MSWTEPLEQIIRKLRDPEKGCLWDKKQTSISLIPALIEEVYELMEASETKNRTEIIEELGDILLHVLFQIQLAEEHQITKAEIIKIICEKLIRRHPHVFSDTQINSVDQIYQNWDHIKREEKIKRESILDGIPESLPALMIAEKLQKKAKNVGFDWLDIQDVIAKVEEEFNETREAIQSKNHKHIEEELGDLLFVIVNMARFLKLDAEQALRKANRKFTRRFKIIEQILKEKNKSFEETTFDELDKLWNIAKQKELNV